MPSSPSWTSERARVAVLTRDHGPDSPLVADARRDLRAARLADYVERVVSIAPPLTDEQRDRVAALLKPTPSGRGDAA